MKNKLRPIIITFIGPVGVGKTTQITLLAKYFKNNHSKTKITYIKCVHGLTFILNGFIEYITNLANNNSVENRNELKKRVFQRITPIWNLIDTLSIASKFLFSVYIPYQMGYNVLLEEGLLMSIEYYKTFRPYFLGVKPVKLPFLTLLLNWTKRQRHLDIVLNASTDEVDKRRKSRIFRRFEKEDYENLQRKIISEINDTEAFKIDTSRKSISEIHHIIFDKIQKINS